MFRKILLSLLLLISALHFSFAQGLRFKGGEHPINERTSLLIPKTGSIPCQDSLSISFDLMIFPEEQYGYLLRMRNKSGKEGPTIDFFYGRMFDQSEFEIIWTGRRFISSLHIPIKELDLLGRWTKVRVKFDFTRDTVSMSVGNKFKTSGYMNMSYISKPEFIFGKNESLIDVPSFAMKNLRIEGGGREIVFPLDQDSGENARSSRRIISGKVSNPVWLMSETIHWKKIKTFSSNKFQCVGYDSDKSEVYLFDRDSIRFINIKDNSFRANSFIARCPIGIFLGSNFYEPRTKKIYAYEVYYDFPLKGNIPSVARLDSADRFWRPISYDTRNMQMHHHNTFVDTARRRFIIYGGFGNRRYNGDFYEFDLNKEEWNRWTKLKGDAIWPRYFSSMGYSEKKNKLYIFGGKGNEFGEQIVGGSYMYDLNEVSVDSLTVTKKWEIPWEGKDCVAARNMVIVEDGFFYVLCYPESCTESEIKLYRFSIEDGSYKILADPIPIYSDKITTNANLYYDSSLARFVATVEESTDDVNSKTTVYTLSYPPQVFVPHNRAIGLCLLIAVSVLILLVLSVTGFIWLLRRRRLRAKIPSNITPILDKPNSILLFGDFTVLDENGNDISDRFTKKLRDFFLVVLKHLEEGGVSSRKISCMLWPDKEEYKAKNVRGVTANALRKQLENLNGICLVFKDKKFDFELTGDLYCDYLEFFNILNSRKPDMDNFIGIVSRGKFLSGVTEPVFDKMKADVEVWIEQIMEAEIKRRYELKQFKNVITCADIIFSIDPLSEIALSYTIKSLIALDKGEEAILKYHAFVTRYRKDYGEDFFKPYESFAEAEIFD